MKKFVATLLVGLVVALVTNAFAAEKKEGAASKPSTSTTSAPTTVKAPAPK